jgi:hypothetical protein
MFAIKAVLSDVQKRLSHLSANYIVWRREYRKRYMALYLAKLENLQHGQDLFGDAAGDNETNDGIEILNEEAAEVPQQEKAVLQQQQGWLNWLSLGMLGTANTCNSSHIFMQEIVKDLHEATKLQWPTPLNKTNLQISKGLICHVAITLHVREFSASLHSLKLRSDIVNMSIQNIGISVQMWSEKSATVFMMVRNVEVVDLSSAEISAQQIIAPRAEVSSLPSSRQQPVFMRSFTEATTAGDALERNAKMVTDEGAQNTELMTPFLHLEIDLEQERENFYICAVAVVIQSVEFTYKATFLEHIATFFSFTVSQQGHSEKVDSSSTAAEQTVIQFKRPMHLTVKMRKPYFLFSANTMASNSNIVL